MCVVLMCCTAQMLRQFYLFPVPCNNKFLHVRAPSGIKPSSLLGECGTISDIAEEVQNKERVDDGGSLRAEVTQEKKKEGGTINA